MKVKIEIAIESNQLSLLQNFLGSLTENKTEEVVSKKVIPAPAEKKEPVKAKKVEVVIEAKVEKIEEAKPETPKNESSVSATAVREALSFKVAEHRDAIKEKLAEYGAANISTLPEEKYQDFHTFLESL